MAKILIVDDSGFSRNVSKRALQAEGFEVLTAADGRQGLSAIEANDPDVVLLDLLMPVLDGFEVLRALQERGDRRPVIVVSADIQETTRDRVLALGARGILNKPVKNDVLVAKVREQLAATDKEAA